MAQQTGQKKRTGKSAATARRSAPARRGTKAASAGAKAPARRPKPAAGRRGGGVARTTELSEDVLRSLEDGQRAAIEAVHNFVDRVDKALPALPRDGDASRRQEIADSALEMADRLVHTQYEFIRRVIDSTGRSLSASGGSKASRAEKK